MKRVHGYIRWTGDRTRTRQATSKQSSNQESNPVSKRELLIQEREGAFRRKWMRGRANHLSYPIHPIHPIRLPSVPSIKERKDRTIPIMIMIMIMIMIRAGETRDRRGLPISRTCVRTYGRYRRRNQPMYVVSVVYD